MGKFSIVSPELFAGAYMAGRMTYGDANIWPSLNERPASGESASIQMARTALMDDEAELIVIFAHGKMDGSKEDGDSRYGIYFDGGSIWYGEDGSVIIYYDDGSFERIEPEDLGQKLELVVVTSCSQDPDLLEDILELEGNDVTVESHAEDEKVTNSSYVAKSLRRRYKIDETDENKGVNVHLVRDEKGHPHFEIY